MTTLLSTALLLLGNFHWSVNELFWFFIPGSSRPSILCVLRSSEYTPTFTPSKKSYRRRPRSNFSLSAIKGGSGCYCQEGVLPLWMEIYDVLYNDGIISLRTENELCSCESCRYRLLLSFSCSFSGKIIQLSLITRYVELKPYTRCVLPLHSDFLTLERDKVLIQIQSTHTSTTGCTRHLFQLACMDNFQCMQNSGHAVATFSTPIPTSENPLGLEIRLCPFLQTAWCRCASSSWRSYRAHLVQDFSVGLCAPFTFTAPTRSPIRVCSISEASEMIMSRLEHRESGG